MGLKEIVEKERSFCIAAGVFISTRVFDSLSTALGVSKFGIECEQNPIARSVMEQMGIVPGLALKNLIMGVGVLGFTYGLNKLPGERNDGNSILYMASAVSLPFVIHNFYQYFAY